MHNKTPEYFGREHFVKLGEVRKRDRIARNTFYVLVGRKVFPLDQRLPEMSLFGLEIVARDQTDLGKLPEFAQYARSPSGIRLDVSGRCEDYALGTTSLRGVVSRIIEGELPIPDRLSKEAIYMCDDLLNLAGVTETDTATR